MNRKTLILLGVFILLPLLLGGLCALTLYFNDLPQRISQHETLVYGQNRLNPGSQAALRVVVRDSKDSAALDGAEIQISLRSAQGGAATTVYRGQTDKQGTADVSFKVPESSEPNQMLVIHTRSRLGADTVERPVRIERQYRVLLTSDKPLYQPGQVIHLRALALSTFDLKPAANMPVELIIADGKGNKVFRQKLTTSEFGVAAANFQLASEVNLGAYKITAELAGVTSEKTVNVERYLLPKFDVKLKTERAYYQPGDSVRGSLQAAYFYGKPVSNGQVILTGYTFDVQRTDVLRLEGKTNSEGNFSFEFNLPSYLAGSDLDGGLARFYLQVSVTDLARQEETSQLSFPVTQNSLIIEAIPEGGRFRPGVDNILYVMTSYPDGAPAETSLSITIQDNNQFFEAKTGAYGLAEIHLAPTSPYQAISIQAQDAQGQTARRDFTFEGNYGAEAVLLRPDHPLYRVGETMTLTILTSQAQGTVYLDIVREGQTVSTRSVAVIDGRAEVMVDLTPDLFGTLELHAYKLIPDGAIVRDTRLVVVDQANDLEVGVTTGQDTYRPGENGQIDVRVTGKQGEGVQAGLGMAIVDESVFALAEQDPGFARLYFMLEEELLKPKYDLHGFSIPQMLEPPTKDSSGAARDGKLQSALDDTAQASLAAAVPKDVRFSLEVNSHADNMQRAYQRQKDYFNLISQGAYAALLLLPLVTLVLSVRQIWRKQRLSQSLAILFGLLLILILLFFLLPVRGRSPLQTSPADRLDAWLGILTGLDAELFILLTILAGLVGYLVLIVVALKHKDGDLGVGLAVLPLLCLVIGTLVYTVPRADLSPSELAVGWGLLAYALLPLGFLMWFTTFTIERQTLAALSALALAGFLLIGVVPSVALLGSTATLSMPVAGANRVQMEEFKQGVIPPMELPLAMPTMAPAAIGRDAGKAADGETGTGGGGQVEPPRLRQYFPETMYWLPDGVTDANGELHLDIPLADSITTWRVTALASSQDGRLGSTVAPLRVFQDFFIDLDLPLALTVGDEISVPVGVFNYLNEAQTVRLELKSEGWFELIGEPTQELQIASNDITVAYFRVRALQFGNQAFQVTAYGSRMSDAIRKEVHVFPDGKQIPFTFSDRLSGDAPVRQAIPIPAEVIPGTQTLVVKIYPGVFSQVVEGLDSILRMPNGCFEQTSSTTYPNVLVMDYLHTTNQASPEVQMKAEQYINLGYQRLATFEVQGSGGFSLFGEPPADRMLTAYGLQEFTDMSRVHDVDPALIRRAADWLFAQQAGDGSWENDRGLVHESTWANLGNDRLPVTGYIAWSLIDAGFSQDARTQRGLEYLRANLAQADDPYVLAMIANALVSADLQAHNTNNQATSAVLDRLAKMAVREGKTIYWKSGVDTFMGGSGRSASVETTALATLALIRYGAHPDLTNAALTWLIQSKDESGTWHTTQATVLSLKALLHSLRGGSEKANATITLTLNRSQAHTVQVTPDNFDVVQQVSFSDLNPGRENVVELSLEGQGNLMYQVAGSYYLPWSKLAQSPDLAGPQDQVTIQVSYDRGELAVNDMVEVGITVTLNEAGGRAESALIDLGLPPGFSVQTEDLEALVTRSQDLPKDYPYPVVQRYELTGRQILIYISNLSAGQPLHFTYHLKAKYPLAAQTPASNVYDYYNPQVSGVSAPQKLVVRPVQ